MIPMEGDELRAGILELAFSMSFENWQLCSADPVFRKHLDDGNLGEARIRAARIIEVWGAE